MKLKVSSKYLDTKDANQTSLALGRKQRRWEVALYISLTFLITSVLFGISTIILPLLGFPSETPITLYFGRCILVLVFPVAFFAAHCLDKHKEAKKAIRELAQKEGSTIRGF